MLIRFGNEKQFSELGLAVNTGESELFSHVAQACKRGLPELAQGNVPAIVCGSGPSLTDTLEKVRELQAKGGKVFALNNTAKYLVENGIHVDYHIMVDPRPENIRFVEKPWADEILLCSQCHPDIFDQCEKIGYKVRLWHPLMEGIQDHIPYDDPLLISVNLTVGLSSLPLIHTMGYRELHLFGYDSCHKEEKSHAFEQKLNENDEIVRGCVDSRVFHCSVAMAGQAAGFKSMKDMLEAHGAVFRLYGDGMIQHYVKSWERQKNQRVLTAIYDLGVSPPTYDFLAFLAEAERYRRHFKLDLLDIVFQPGPMNGFRDDELPPDLATRKNMLWGVCVEMARLLPSVRNIEVLTERKAITGDIFPTQWKEDAPVSHYGVGFLKDSEPFLKATEYGKKQVALRFSKPYATITLREANYWPQRNSNRYAWQKVANWLKANNIQPVIIPDTDGTGLSVFEETAEFQAASFNLELRTALYEGAVINLGVLNGPMSVCAFMDCRYIIFNVGGQDMAAGSTDFLKANGLEIGAGFGANGKLVWEKDDAEIVIRELKEFEVKQLEKTS